MPNHPRIFQRIPYIDTVWILLGERDGAAVRREMDWLKSVCGSVRRERIKRRRGALGTRFRFRLILHQPAGEALQFLHWLFVDKGKSRIVICRLDASLDLVVVDASAAVELQHYMEQCLVQRWHRGFVTIYKSTMYTRRRKSHNNIAIYSDRPSKITGEPCCHMEWRIVRARTLRGVGICHLQDVSQIEHRRFWRDRLRIMVQPDTQKLGKAMMKMGRRRKPWLTAGSHGIHRDVFARAGSTLLRCTQTENLPYTAQELLRLSRRLGVNITSCFQEVDNEEFLPDESGREA